MTKAEKLSYLTERAQHIMYMSKDPIHEASHVARVVDHCTRMSIELSLSEIQTQALILAAWWHDASRVLTKNPSFIMMPLVDDLLSALLLWRETIRCGLFGSVAGMATRIIFCKSFGAGRILTKILMTKKNQLLIDALKDADTLDLLHTSRMDSLLTIAEHSVWYERGYRFMVWWFLRNKQLYMHTVFSREHIVLAVQEFLDWFETPEVLLWHIDHFGESWVQKNRQHGDRLIEHICLLLPQDTSYL
ncbi:MAG: hypothetical protein GW939_02515 [Candidatus Magasanikbacteria bacterium]|nr:hypothetical protein [Candidatus Magasanikbacteria bacterium]